MRPGFPLSWISALNFKNNYSRKKQRPSRRNRGARRAVSVEWLEDRTLLSVFTVTNSNDSGAGSLRQAILDANSAGSTPPNLFFTNFGDNTIRTVPPTGGTPTVFTVSGLNGPEGIAIDAQGNVYAANSNNN